MTEMKLTRNSGYSWTRILFKKIDDNHKKMKKTQKKYSKKRVSIVYKDTNDFVMKSNDINNQQTYETQMINAKYTRAMYLYIMRNYYTIFSFHKAPQHFVNITLKRGEFLYEQCKDIIQQDTHTIQEKKYLQLTMNTFDKFKSQYSDPLQHGYFILFIFKKMRICNDLSRFICTFI